MKKLDGQVALVTGASKGIGAGIAKGLAQAGASVAVNYATSREGADSVVAEIEAQGGKAVAVRGDVSKAADVQRMFAETKKAFGRLDILVNNAGVYEFQTLEEITEEHFHRHFDVNVLGLLLTSREALRYFDGGGSIINISSTATSLTPPATAVYTGTKGAVDAITRTLAKELGPRNIRVNAINPGMVLTEGVRAGGFDQSEFRTQMEAQAPLRRIGEVEDVAPAAVFLASPDSAWIAGETLRIAGGLR